MERFVLLIQSKTLKALNILIALRPPLNLAVIWHRTASHLNVCLSNCFLFRFHYRTKAGLANVNVAWRSFDRVDFGVVGTWIRQIYFRQFAKMFTLRSDTPFEYKTIIDEKIPRMISGCSESFAIRCDTIYDRGDNKRKIFHVMSRNVYNHRITRFQLNFVILHAGNLLMNIFQLLLTFSLFLFRVWLSAVNRWTIGAIFLMWCDVLMETNRARRS